MQKNKSEEASPLRASAELPAVPSSTRRKALVLMPGMRWNPLRKLPRNRLCPCLSGQKFKACCLPMLPLAVPAKQADEFEAAMKKPDLVFATRENQGRLVGAAKEEIDRIDEARRKQREEVGEPVNTP